MQIYPVKFRTAEIFVILYNGRTLFRGCDIGKCLYIENILPTISKYKSDEVIKIEQGEQYILTGTNQVLDNGGEYFLTVKGLHRYLEGGV